MYNTISEAIAALGTTETVLNALLRNVSQADAQVRREGEKEWAIIEVVCHLRDVEELVIRRVQILRDEPAPVVSGFNADAVALERNYIGDNLATALAAFFALRHQHIAMLSVLEPAQWERVGQHTANGPITILNHTLHAVWHDANHLAQIARQVP